MIAADTSAVSESTEWGFLQSVLENALHGNILTLVSAAIAALLVVGLIWGLKKIYAHRKVTNELTAARQNTFDQEAARCAAAAELLRQEVDNLNIILERINRSDDDTP